MSSSSPDDTIFHVYMLKFKCIEHGSSDIPFSVVWPWTSIERFPELCKASPTRSIVEAGKHGFFIVELIDVAHKSMSEFTPLEQVFMRKRSERSKLFEMSIAKRSGNASINDYYLFYVGKDVEPAEASHLSEDGVYGTWAPAFRHMMAARKAAMELPFDEIDRLNRTVWFIDTEFPLFSSGMAWVFGTVTGRSPSHAVIVENYRSYHSDIRTSIKHRVFDTKEQADAFRRERSTLPWFFVPEVNIEPVDDTTPPMRVDAAPKSDFFVEFMSGSGLLGDEEDFFTPEVCGSFLWC